jgi:hypothetical protein
MGGRTVGPELAWDLVQAYLTAEYSQANEICAAFGQNSGLGNGLPAATTGTAAMMEGVASERSDRVQLQLVLLKAHSINAQPTMTFRRDANDES